MPLYEYHCEPCEHTFELLVRGADDHAACPWCGSDEHLHKQFSVPASAHTASGTRAGSNPLPIAGCGASMCCGGGMCATD